MVRLSLTKDEAEFLSLGLSLGIRGLDQETYPPFIEHLGRIKAKLVKQGID
ncbi:hypothetical protein KAU33_15380 [Candidatus Dependentiae bacterium]|nr:hypothetical protein [Candidatus Dependentiae bacterium]